MKKDMAAKRSRSKDIADVNVEQHADDWVDPREKKERRLRSDSSKVPPSGCRRESDRRVTRYIRDDQWWLHRGYNNCDD